MDQGNSTEIFDSYDLFASGESSSNQSINISLIKVNREPLHYSDKKTNYLQECFGTPVLYNGLSYTRKVNPNKGSEMLGRKSFLDIGTKDQEGYSLIEMLRSPNVTKLSREIRDFEAPIIEIKDENIRITSYPNENELQIPVLKDLTKNIEAYYRGYESASLKTSTKRMQYDKNRDGIASMCNEILQDNGRNAVRKAGNETIWYECQKCYLEFCTPKGLANHIKTHPKVMIEKNTCVYCRKCFDNANNLSDHLHAEHMFDIMTYTCESCLVECISADLFDKHQYSCHRKQDTSCLFCSNCDKVYYDQEMLNYHKEQQKHCHICCLNYCMSSDQFKTHKEKHILFKYKCVTCNASFITKAALTKHIEMKNLCFQILSDKGVNHVKSYNFDHEQMNEFGINSEGNEDVEDNMVEENHLSSKKEKTHKCLLCTAKFALVKNMWRHVAVIHQKALQFESLQHLPTPIGHQCTMCEKKLTTKSNLVAHMATHIRGTCSMDNGQPQCSICHKTFRKQRYLVDHMRLHTGRGTHQCRHCDKKFLRQSHLKSHMEMHDSFHKFHSCPHCDKTYMRKRDKMHHVRVVHGSASDVIFKTETVKMEGFSCSSCDKTFSSVLKLQMHEVIHTVTKPPYKCQECSQDFPTLSTLKRHYLIHWDLRPFSCSVCSKGFRYKQSLKRHMMTHTGEKPHVCKHCGKGFALKGTLNVHMQQHSTVRTFKCYKCEAVFESKQELKSHLCSRISKQVSLAESVCTELYVYSKPNTCTYNDSHNSTRKENESMANVPSILNDSSVTTLISDTCVDNLLPVTGLNSDTITKTVMPVRQLITEVNEMITINGTASNCFSETPFEVKFSNQPSGNKQAHQNVEDTFEENTLLQESHLQNGKQTDVLSESCQVTGENKNESLNLDNCSILEAKQDIKVNETTIYTLVTIDGELKQPTFISIPTISNCDSEENVTLQIHFPEDGCSEVFIIES